MIRVRNLVKNYGDFAAVRDISFDVEQGEIFAFLGPNGAGKTTTMKMLSCFFPPDGGTALVAGHDVLAEPLAVKRCVGYLAENAPAYDEMTAASFLSFVCEARGLKGAARREAIERVVEWCSLGEVMHQPIGTLSKGYRRRVGLAQALAHDPPVLILDEPTDGLDPNQKHDVRELIKKLAPQKSTIISTHLLEEMDALCSRIVIISRGRILVDSTPKDLRQKEGAELDRVFRKLTTRRAPADAGAKAGGVA
jgi:gliding motility-associated transport system ATP-binding protein